MQVRPVEAFDTYRALKLHFTTPKYDFFKYGGKTRPVSLESRRDKYQFHKLSKKKDLINFLVANFVYNDHKWVGDLFEDEGESAFLELQKRQQSITYLFRNDIDRIRDSFLSHFKVKNGQLPSLISLYNRGTITIETIIILNDLLKFFPIWDDKIADTIIWPSLRMKCEKYKPFLSYDRSKAKAIIDDVLSELKE